MSDSQNNDHIGVIVVDHGSRRAESNEMLEELTRTSISARLGYDIVEPAHMELAEPSISTAFDRCVERGATMVVIQPYFLPNPGTAAEHDAGTGWFPHAENFQILIRMI
jgi:sirohydrochlorin ferrochelatase